jgi:invasion protein IalB
MSHSVRLFVILFVFFLLPYHSSEAVQKFTRSQAYGDWVLNCSKESDPEIKTSESCSLHQQVMTEKGARLLSVSIATVSKREEKIASFSLPLGFYIPDGVKITVGKGKTRRLLVTMCTQKGCFAEIILDKELSRELSLGKKLKLALLTGDRVKNLDFSVSLKGISVGLRSVK